MAPVATHDQVDAKAPTTEERIESLKKDAQVFNPFYSPSIGDDGDDTYEFAQYKVCFRTSSSSRIVRLFPLQPSFPNLSWEPLKEVPFSDRGLVADPEKKNLLGAAQKVRHLTPAIGTELLGIDLRQLTDAQKDEL
jgi:sulfonate dioxygenase